MWDKVLEIIKTAEPLILVVIPFAFGLYLKIRTKCLEKQAKINKENDDRNNKKLVDWMHEESISVMNQLKECCNYHCDQNHTHASYIQLENGTLATSKMCNMFFSCVSEDNRYSDMRKLISTIQRVPYIQMSEWFHKINEASKTDDVVCVIDNVGETSDIFKDLGIKTMMSCLVHDTEGLVIGVCNFTFSEADDLTDEHLEELKSGLYNFVTGVETVFLSYKVNTDNKKKQLNI